MHSFRFLLEFYCVLFLCNFVVCRIWQFLLLLRSLKMTQMTVYNFVIVFYVIVNLYWIGYIFRHNRKALLDNDSFVVLVPLGLPCT